MHGNIVYYQIKQRHCACVRAMWVATLHFFFNLELLGFIFDIGLQMYLFLMNLTPSHLRLDSKQLVSEFLQDALSKRMRQCFGAG